MLYIIKNVSENNIVIGKGVLKPNKEMRTYNLKPFQKMIDSGYVELEIVQENVYQKQLNNNQDTSQIEQNGNKTDIKNNFIKENLKQNLIESFFNLYLTKDVSDKDLKLLKWFYKNINYTQGIKSHTLNLLDEVENGEELIEILINHIYPELLDLYFINEEK